MVIVNPDFCVLCIWKHSLVFSCHKKGTVFGLWGKKRSQMPLSKQNLLSERDLYLWGLMAFFMLQPSLKTSENSVLVAMDTTMWKPCLPLLLCDCIVICAIQNRLSVLSLIPNMHCDFYATPYTANLHSLLSLQSISILAISSARHGTTNAVIAHNKPVSLL